MRLFRGVSVPFGGIPVHVTFTSQMFRADAAHTAFCFEQDGPAKFLNLTVNGGNIPADSTFG